MTLGERVFFIRKNILKESRNAFGERFSVSGDELANIEHDRLNRPDAKIPLLKLIAKTVGVDEKWLLTGEGDWEINIDREDEIIGFAQKIAMPGEESFKKDFLHTLSQLDERDWETLEKIALLMQKEKS
jgi:hypothetical protein